MLIDVSLLIVNTSECFEEIELEEQQNSGCQAKRKWQEDLADVSRNLGSTVMLLLNRCKVCKHWKVSFSVYSLDTFCADLVLVEVMTTVTQILVAAVLPEKCSALGRVARCACSRTLVHMHFLRQPWCFCCVHPVLSPMSMGT